MKLSLKNSIKLTIQLVSNESNESNESKESQDSISIKDQSQLDVNGSILIILARLLWLENYKKRRSSRCTFPYKYQVMPVLPWILSRIQMNENKQRIMDSISQIVSDNGIPILLEQSMEENCPLWILKLLLPR